MNVLGEICCRCVATLTILLEGLHDNPVKFPTEPAPQTHGVQLAIRCRIVKVRVGQPLTRYGELRLTDDSSYALNPTGS